MTIYEKLECVGNLIKIPITSHQVVVFPTDDETKLHAFNEYTDNGLHTGFSDVTLLAKSYDEESGLFWMSRPYIVILDDTFNFIYVYQFPERPKSIEVDAEGGAIVELIVNTTNCLCWKSRISHCAPTRDTDGDGCPDCLDLDYATSIKTLFRSASFNFDWQTQHKLTQSIIDNDFGITSDDIEVFPFAVSHGNPVYDADMNRLTPVETTDVEGGSVDTYDVKALSEVRVRDLPGNNAGDVTVWDYYDGTKTRVTDPNWVFEDGHECWIENGLIRFIPTVTTHNNVFAYIDGGYVSIARYYYATDSVIQTLTSDEVVVSGASTVSLRRGDPYISIEFGTYHVVHNLPEILTNVENVYDSALIGEDSYFTLSPTGSALVFVDRGGTYTGFVSTDSSGGAQFGNQNVGTTHYLEHGEAETVRVGALPISPVYIEAASYAFGFGVIIDDVGAASGQAVKCQDGYFISPPAAMSSLAPGSYIAFFRVRGDPSANVRLYVFDYTLYDIISSDLSYDMTSEYNTQSVDFTISPENVGNSIKCVALYHIGDFVIDYILIVPTGAIQQAAERSLVQVDTAKTVLKLPR